MALGLAQGTVGRASLFMLIFVLGLSSATIAKEKWNGAAKAAASSGPSLKETVDWIVNAINSNKPETVKSRYRWRERVETLIRSNTAKPISKASFEVESRIQEYGGSISRDSVFVYVVDGALVDPTSISVERKSMVTEGGAHLDGHASVFAVCGTTTNRVKAITVSASHKIDGQLSKDEVKWSDFCLYLVSENDAVRLSMALRHFAALAGGKGSSRSAF
jgi:hypothetical protein